jgi:uncharacterized damage-inducible protein DinB
LSEPGFLDRPGQPGMFGALLDEYARAAEDLCRTVEALPEDLFARERESPDPETVSLQAVCGHVAVAAWNYADYIRIARGLPRIPRPYEKDAVTSPAAFRPLLAQALRHTEATVDGCPTDQAGLEALRFQVRWGPVYDPEMILEHAIVHLLRHRRQIERW